MRKSCVFALRVDPNLMKRLDRLSRVTSRSLSFVAADAIREYLDWNDYQIRDTKKALEEADSGDFASRRDVKRMLKKWIPNMN